MAMTLEEFIAKSGAELVGGKLVVGVQGDRIVVGHTDPAFELNEDGQILMADLEAGDTVAEATADMTTARQIKESGANADVAKKAKVRKPVVEAPAAPAEPFVIAPPTVTAQAVADEAARLAAQAAAMMAEQK